MRKEAGRTPPPSWYELAQEMYGKLYPNNQGEHERTVITGPPRPGGRRYERARACYRRQGRRRLAHLRTDPRRAALPGSGALGDRPAPEASTRWSALERHDPAPSFTLPVLSDAFFAGQPEFESLEDYRGEYVLLAFWATWCGTCREEYQEFVALELRFRERGLRVLGILHRESPRRTLRFMEDQKGSTYTSLVDEGEGVARRYQVWGLPRTIVIGPNGRIVDIVDGWAQLQTVARRFDGVLPVQATVQPHTES